jgi:hypothetical protein
VIEELEAADAAVGPVIVDVDATAMQNVIARLSATPGAIRWKGRGLDADGVDIRRDGWGETAQGIGSSSPSSARTAGESRR